jgi:hypothetical protein
VWAADQLIPGKIAIIKPYNLVEFVSKGTFSLPSGPSDPLLHGATLHFFDTISGGTGGDITFNLPPGDAWKAFGGGTKGFKYHGAGSPSDPCKVVLITSGVIKAVCKSWSVALTVPIDGDLGVVLTTGTGMNYCAEFGGTTLKNGPSVFKRNGASEPSVCPFVLPTPSSTPTVTQTPTPTPPAGELVYNIDPGTAGVGPDQSGSGLFVGIIGNTNAAVTFSPGPLTLVMGKLDSNGIASLTLKDDVTISIDIIDGTCMCLKLFANNEFGGTINCNGGSMYDTMATRAANAPDLTWIVTTGLGSPSGAGDANLLLAGLFDHVSSSCAAADCPTHTYINPANEFAFTTTNATAVQNVSSGPPITLTDPGSPFNCANFGMPGSGGKLAAPVPTVLDPVGPVAAVLRIAEMATP